jgi:hypothetical protein
MNKVADRVFHILMSIGVVAFAGAIAIAKYAPLPADIKGAAYTIGFEILAGTIAVAMAAYYAIKHLGR